MTTARLQVHEAYKLGEADFKAFRRAERELGRIACMAGCGVSVESEGAAAAALRVLNDLEFLVLIGQGYEKMYPGTSVPWGVVVGDAYHFDPLDCVA